MKEIRIRTLFIGCVYSLLVCGYVGRAGAQPQFVLPESPTGSSAEVVVTDLNGDGKLDVVDTLGSYALGGGDGTFNTAHGGVFVPGSTFVATGDLNGDGIPDFVFIQPNNEIDPGVVTVILGAKGGKLQAGPSYPLSDLGDIVVLADLNGDGKLDIIVNGPGLVGVYLGNGDGTFQAEHTYAVTGNAFFAVADINHDNIPDIVTVGGTNSMSVLLGNGDGSFKPAASQIGFNSPRFVSLADVNGDGNVDAVIADGNSGGHILLGNGDGTFQAPTALPAAGDFWLSVTLADLNGDKHPDLIATDNFCNVIVMINDGSGSFGTPAIYQIGAGQTVGAPFIPSVADINGDGHPDLVVPVDNNNSVVTMLNNNGDGTFPALPTLSGTRVVAIAALDMNGDGKADLLSAEGDDTIKVRLGNGDGTFQAPLSYDTGEVPTVLIPVSLDGHAHTDAVIVTADFLETWINDGHGALTEGAGISLLPGELVLGVGDFNGDGFSDVVTIVNGASPVVRIHSGSSAGFDRGSAVLITLPGEFAFGGVAVDLNHDGKLDLVIATTASMIYLLGDGKGGFTLAQHLFQGCNLPFRPVVHDMNNDGIPDVVCGAGIEYGNGDGTFQPMVFTSQLELASSPSLTTSGPSAGAVVADMNGDGMPDIVICGGYSSMMVIYQGPDGKFHAPRAYEMGSRLTSCAVADVNGDGRPDLIAASSQVTNAISISTQLSTEHPPTLQGFSAQVTPNTKVDGTLQASDSDGDVLTFLTVTIPANGQLSFDRASGTFSYFSIFGQSDSFDVVVDDGTEFSPVATVTIQGTASAGSGGSSKGSGGGGGPVGDIELTGLAILAVLRRLYSIRDHRV